MKLIGALKKQVENEGTREGRRVAIKKAGMVLTDDELDKVAGGGMYFGTDDNYVLETCPHCGNRFAIYNDNDPRFNEHVDSCGNQPS